MRNKALGDNGPTPAQCVHGFLGSNTLQTALGQIKQIPEDYPLLEWTQEVIRESKRALLLAEQYFDRQSEDAAKTHYE